MNMLRNELMESIFGEIMKENTPYEKILTFHPFSTAEERIVREQLICDEMNKYLKHSYLHLQLPIVKTHIALSRPRLTLKTLVDLKLFALKIGYRFCVFTILRNCLFHDKRLILMSNNFGTQNQLLNIFRLTINGDFSGTPGCRDKSFHPVISP